MSLRPALYQLAETHKLDSAGTQALFAAAGLDAEPPAVARGLWPVTAILAAGLVGLGLIFWLAANWDTLGRIGRFALLQGVVAVMCGGAAWRAGLRTPLGLLALLCIGGLWAFFGQTYQTGADAWQLFALWAALILPLCLGARSDVLWAPWAMVSITAVSLWTFAHVGHQWRVDPQDLGTYAMAWAASALVVAALSPALTRWTGAGPWALRTAVVLTVVGIATSALFALFTTKVAPHYTLALAGFALAAGVLALRRCYEVFALSAVALALNALLVGGAARWLFDDHRGDPIGQLLVLGLGAAGVLAASVAAITRLARHYADEGSA